MSDIKAEPSQTRQQKIEFAETVIKNLFEKIGILCSLEIQDNGEEIWFSVKTDDSILSFQDTNKSIAAFNTILRRIIEKNFGDDAPKFLIDINEVQKKHIEEIKDTARMHAQRVRYFKKEIEMPPMNAYERRLVHTVLQEYPDIKTESAGEGFERRVVVKPVSLG
ncbi:MAG: R3H domain-containing nucleic acid-binding protein [Patescibacteria group bacterium]